MTEGEYGDGAFTSRHWLTERRTVAALPAVGARLRVQVCRYSALDDLECDDRGALELLNDEFIGALPADRQAEAYSLRGQARYWLTESRGLPAAAARPVYQTALDDLDQARQRRDDAVDHYFRGLVLAEIDALDAALSELTWVRYWDAVYDYPFLPEDFEQQVMGVEARAEAAREAAQVTATVTVRPTTAGEDESPTPAGNTPTPAPTIPFEERPQLP